MDKENTQKKQLPVCIVTGFLGAGKTTLLNRILTGDHGLRIGVLVNDFGEIDIDSQIVEHVAEDTLSLSNGCICCSMRHDFLRAIMTFTQRDAPPDLVVIETSGVSDPSAVVFTLTHPALAGVLRVDSVLTVVDGVEFLDLAEEATVLAETQIATADVVVVNKTDLTTPERLSEVDHRIRKLVPEVRLFHTQYGKIPQELFFSIDDVPLSPPALNLRSISPLPHNEDRPSPLINAHPSKPAAHHHDHGCHGGHDCGCEACAEEAGHAGRSTLTAAFESVSLTIDPPLALDKLRRVLTNLPRNIYRLKGLFFVDANPDRQLLIQVVGSRISAAESKPWSGKPKRSEIAAIGLKGSAASVDLAELFKGCLAKKVATSAPRLSDRIMFWRRNPLPEERPFD